MSLNYAITQTQICSLLPRRSTDICHRPSSFYTWPRPNLFLKPTILSWSNYGRVDLSRTGKKRKIGIPNNTHTQFTIGHQFWKWIKPAQKQMNKAWLKWASASLPKNVKCMKLESCLLMLRLYWYIVNLQWCFKYYMYFYIAVNLTAK